MKKHQMTEVKEANINVTPLIDVVMCLIIFFMLVAKIGVSTGAEAMPTLPETILGRQIDAMGTTLTLNIHKVGESSMSRIVTMVPNLETGNPEQKEIALVNPTTQQHDLELLLRLWVLKMPDTFNVIIRAEGDVPYEALEPILLTCTQAKVKTVSFNTKQKPAE
jgi:biopolymer transport protein ExbD